jgi:IPT/TIG domain
MIRSTATLSHGLSLIAAALALASCSKKLDGPAPALQTKGGLPVSPAIVCGDQLTTELTVSGERFSPVPVNVPEKPAIALPSLTLSRSAALDGGDASAVKVLYGGDPTAPSNTLALGWNSQSEMTFEINQSLTIDGEKRRVPSGIYDVRLVNPNRKQTSRDAVLAVVDKPEVTETTPAALCLAKGDRELTIHGSNLLKIKDALPSVQVDDDGASFDVSALEDCTAIAQKDADAEVCGTARVTLPTDSLEPGLHKLVLTNPETAACHTEEDLELRVVAIPTITGVNPTNICSDVMTTFTVTGTGFDPDATASVDGVAASDVQFVSDTELQVTVSGISPGVHGITIINEGDCSATLPAVLTVDPSPIVFFVDPPVLYSDVPVEITIFTSGLSSDAAKVELVSGDTRQNLTFTSAGRPNKILAQVPAGLTPATWDVVVTNSGGCPGALPGGLTVTDTLTDPLVTSIKPSYASTTEDTAVTVSGAGFVNVPRVYLSTSGATGAARALRAVEVKGGGATLTAVIPSGLAPNTYDLIVVNPDGKVDVLSGGVTITGGKPPVVTSVTPASLPANASGVSVTISGTNFKNGVTVELDCLLGDGTHTTVPTTEQLPSGDGKTVVVNVTMANATPMGVSAGNVCLVRLTNADGAFFEYSAFSITNSSLNLSAWQAAPDLTTARRALALAAGRPTATSRFIYAIGGDNGVSNMPTSRGSTVFDSLESSQVDVFGAMSDWSAQRNHLVAPRTAAGAATIGRFVYLVGGHDGTSATNTLLRASILDPLAGPEVVDIDAALSDGNVGLTKGLYYYRVSALRAASDLDNPGGETLSGELLPVALPERAEKIALTLKWAQVTGAHGYRIYRSPQANAAADSLELLGEITCGAANDTCNCNSDPTRCQWIDSGGATMASGTPLPAGSLGVWHAVNGARCTSGDCLMGTAREGMAVTALNEPGDTNVWYLYAFGGRNGSGYLDTYEVAKVTIASDGAQTVADFAPGADTLNVPRADHGVWVMTRNNSNVIASSGSPNDVWIYVGGGRTTGDTNDQTLEAGKLASNGILNAFIATDSLNGALVGFGTGASNDQLYTFGGITGSADGTSAQLCNGMGSCGPLPDLKSGAFNALGAATTHRVFTASTQESAFFFVAGGHDGASAIKSSQRTVQ